MKQVLVPTDFSKIAERAYPVAAQIAKATDAKILLFYVHVSHIAEISDIASFNTMAHLANQAEAIDIVEEKKAQQKFQELINSPVFKGVEVDYEVSLSFDLSTEKDILNYLNSKEHSLVVMGTEGEEQKDRHISEYVARHTLHPVITINNDDFQFAPENIIVCTDLKTLSTGFVQRMSFLAEKLEANLKLLYINTAKNFKNDKDILLELTRIKNRYQLKNCSFETVNAYKVEDGIIDYLEGNNKDLIALCTHGRTGLSHFFNGSHTEDLIVNAPVAVYSYNLHKYLDSLYGHDMQANYTRGFTG